MRSLAILAALAVVVACAAWTYREAYATKAALSDVAELRRAIALEREALSVLNAEWAYLNRPERLQALAEAHFLQLRLMPLIPEHFGETAMVPFPLEGSIRIEAPVETLWETE